MMLIASPKRILWLLIFIFFLFSGAVGTGGYFFYQKQRQSIKQEKWDNLKAIADLKADQVTNWVKERKADASAILENPLIAIHVQRLLRSQEDSELKQKVLAWMNSLRKYYDYRAVFLIDGKRSVRLRVGDEREPLGSYAKTLATEAMRTKKVLLSDLHQGETERDIHMDLVTPLLSTQGSGDHVIGAVLLRIDPKQFLYPLIQSWPMPSETGETLLVHREGEEVVFLNELRHQKGTVLTLRSPIDKRHLPAAMAARGQEGIVEGTDYREIPVLAAIRRIPESPWSLIAKVDQEEIYAPIHSQARSILILIGVLILGMASVVLLLWRGQYAEFQKKQCEAEAKRLALAQRFDYLSKYANDIILLLDEDLRIIEANNRTLETYGYTQEELMQLSVTELQAPEARLNVDAQIKQVKERNGYVFETLHQRKNGTTFSVETSSRLIEVEGGKVYQAIIRDITERKRVEEALRVSHRFLEIGNRHTGVNPLLTEFVVEVQKFTQCAAVGIRILNEEGNIPYQAYKGFSQRFYESESPLSIKSDQCMCINVVKGVTDPKVPFYTEGGSFYMNGTTRFLATVSEEEKGQTRNVCNQVGYESVALVPIRIGVNILGLIHVADPDENKVPLRTVQILEKVAMQLGEAIQRIRMGEETQRRLRELEARQRVIEAILKTLDLDKRLSTALFEIMKLIETEIGGIYLVERDRLILRIHQGLPDDLLASLRDLPIAKTTWARETTVHHERLSERGGQLDEICKRAGIQSWVAIPLKVEDRLIGTFSLSSRRYEAFSADDVRALLALAELVAVAVENARLYTEAQQRLARLTTLREIDRAIAAQLSLKDIMDVVLKQVPFHIVGVDAVGFSLIDWEKKHTSVALLHLQGGAHVEDEAFRLSESLMGDLVKHRRPVVIYDLQTDPRIQNYREIIRQYGLKSYLGVPLVAQDQTIGLLHVLTTEPRYFRDEEVDFFATMAGQAGIALRNAQFFEEIKTSEKRYRSLFDRMPVGLYRTTPEGKIIDVNPALVQILGYPDQESLLGINVAETYVDPKDRVQWQSLIEREGIVRNYEMQIRRRDGTIIWVEENTRVIHNPEGQVLYYEGSLQDITERKRAEEALRESEEKYRALIEAAGRVGEGIIIIQDSEEHEGAFVFVNDRFCTMSGYSREELLGRPAWDLVPHEISVWLRDWYKRRHMGESLPTYYEAAGARKDGAIVPLELSVVTMPWQGKTATALYLRDITERKRAEEALRESEERWMSLTENSPDHIMLLDLDGTILFINRTVPDLTKEEVIGTSNFKYMPPEYHQIAADCFKRVLARGRPDMYTTVYHTKEGEVRYFDVRVGPVFKSGQVVAFISSSTDITERKQAEEAQRETEELYRTILQTSPDGIAINDTEGRITFVSERMLSLYGLIYPEDVIGHSPFEFIAPEDHARARLNMQNVFKNNYTSYNQYTLVKKDGTKFTGEINSSLLRDASGKPRGMISVVRDITERKQAEKERDQLFEQVHASRERLRNLSRRLVEVQEVERRELVRKLHDEVGQNLTALSINLNIVHSQLPPETVTKTAIRIDDSLKLVEETVERIRDVMAELRPPVLDDYGLSAALHWYGKQFSERTGITTLLQIEELKPRLPLSAETALFRIAQEALTNVAKYAQAKNVTVRLEEFGESVQLSIADDGIGFDSEAHQQPEAKSEWGLINMRERSQAVGGTLNIETAPGKGTKIVVEVPRKH